MRELLRIWSRPKLYLVLVLLCVMNLALFAGFCQTQADQNAYTEETTAKETAAYLESGYAEYLAYVSKQSSTQSILGTLGKQSDFIRRNREQTISDYAALEGIVLQAGEDDGVNALLSYTTTDFLLLIAPLLLIMEFVTVQHSACGALIHSTQKGRVSLLLWRMLSLLLLSALSAALLWGSNAAYTGIFFGDPVYHRAVQSIPAFQHCTLPISVGGFLLLWGLLKTAAVFCISVILWLVLSVCQQALAALMIAVLLGAQWLCYVLPDATSALNHLKYCNVFAALEGGFFFTDYNNLNWFGFPVGMLASCVTALGLMLLLICTLLILLVGMAYPFRIGARLQAYTERLQKWYSARFGCHSLFLYEGKKLLIAQRGLAVIAIAVLMGISIWNDTRLYIPISAYWNEVYADYGGAVTDERMDAMNAYVDELYAKVERCKRSLQHTIDLGLGEYWILDSMGDLAEAEQKYEFYRGAQAHMQSLYIYSLDSGKPIWFIPEESYQALFSAHGAAKRCALLLLLYVIFLCAGLGAYENRFGAAPLLRSTKRGRLCRNGSKVIWVLLTVIPATLLIHGIYYQKVLNAVPLAYNDAPVQSLEILREFPISISIGTFLILWTVLRIAAALTLGGVSAWLGSKCRTQQNALLLCLMVFFLPTALAASGMTLLQPLDFSAYLGVFIL